MARDLDYAPLTSRPRLRPALRALAGNNLHVMAATIGALLLAVPLVVLVGLVVTGHAGDDVGALFFLGFLLLCGLFVAGDLLGRSSGSAGLEAFARANDLELLGASLATHYASREFASGRSSVHQGVRTRDASWVEVGERFPIGEPVGRDEPRRTRVYLRVRLARPVRGRASSAFVDPALDADLTAWAGAWSLEVSGDEVTVLGTDALEPRRPGRVRDGFDLAHRLVERAEAVLPSADEPAPTPSGIPLPAPEQRRTASGRPVRPLVVVVSMLGLLVVLPLGFAFVMSTVEGSLRGNDVGATVVVWAFVGFVGLVVGGFARAVVRPRAGRRRD